MDFFIAFCLRIYALYNKKYGWTIDKSAEMLYNIKNTC